MKLPHSDTHRPWPLYVLAAPATVAVWSGWVGLGEMTGFGMVHPLPGIADNFSLNTAITLPIGVECYAAYALGAWLSSRPLSKATRGFAKWSALGALLLGGGGQIAYHLLEVGAAAGTKISAPVWITTIVACIPVVVLGLGATLAHLIHRDGDTEPNPNPVQIPLLTFETQPPTAQRDRSGARSETPVAPASETQSSDPDREETQTAEAHLAETGPKTQTQTARKTKPAKARQTGPKTKTNPDSDLLKQARLLDSAHLQDHGRHISAENLRKALRIAKPAALELVKQVRGAHMDIAK